MALVKSGIGSLCLSDDNFGKVWNSNMEPETLEMDQNNHIKNQVDSLSHKIVCNRNYFDPIGFNKDVVKGLVDLFKIVCSTSNEVVSGSLESKYSLISLNFIDCSFPRVLIDDSNQLTEIETLIPLTKGC